MLYYWKFGLIDEVRVTSNIWAKNANVVESTPRKISESCVHQLKVLVRKQLV